MTTFSRSMRSLAADGFHRSILGLLLIVILLGAVVSWLFLAKVALYEVTETARLEVARGVYPVEAPVAGRVVATHVALSQEVQVGDVLIELDSEAERLQLKEERARLTDLSRQLDALREEVTAVEQAQREARQVASLSLDEARARQREAEAVAQFAEEESDRLTRLNKGGYLDEVILLQAKSEAQKRQAAADAFRLAVSRMEWEQKGLPLSLDEARARQREAGEAAELAEEESKRLTRLYQRDSLAEADFLRAKSEARQRRDVAEALRLQVSRLEWKLQGTPLEIEEARARHREAETAAQLAKEEVDHLTRMHQGGHLSDVTLRRTKAEAQQRRAAAEALWLAVNRLEWEQRTNDSNQRGQLAQLKREVAQLEGAMATTTAAVDRLEYEIEKRRIRAPVAGQIGEFTTLETGSVVREGDKVGTIIPPEELKAIAHFLPSAALGRIRPGQPAQIRLAGFHWTQYGSLSATVARVASEIHDGRVRVELTVPRHLASPIPFQHGLPGTVEVEVDHVSAATLVLRAAGRFLAGPRTAHRGKAER